MSYSITRNSRDLEGVLRCPACRSGVRIEGDRCRCEGCGRTQEIWRDAIITDERLRTAHDDEDVEYAEETKTAYQSEERATLYLRRYKSVYGYSALIAMRERHCVAAALRQTGGVRTVLDLPAGTGKLASVHERFGYRVIAGDASAHMLWAGMGTEWDGASTLLGAVQTDVTATNLKDDAVDCAICLRLMHRLPLSVIRPALTELSRVASGWIIVSFGVSDAGVARFARRPKPSARAKIPRNEWRRILSEFGEVVSECTVLPGISTEVVALLKK